MSKIEIMPNQPLVSIDAVPIIVKDGHLQLVLGIREFEPFAGQAALPGVLLNAHERLTEAVSRALLSKIGVKPEQITAALDVGVFDDFERDERGPTLSITRLVVLEASLNLADKRVRLLPVTEIGNLPFDHSTIVAKSAEVLLDALWINVAVTRALLGPTFDTAMVIAQMKELSLAAGRTEPETGNVGRSLASNRTIQRASNAALSTGRGRPPAQWEWI